jgi:hypothetical protein
LIDTVRISEASIKPEAAAALQPALARYKVAEVADGTQFRKKARLLATAAIGVALLPPAAARHNRR